MSNSQTNTTNTDGQPPVANPTPQQPALPVPAPPDLDAEEIAMAERRGATPGARIYQDGSRRRAAYWSNQQRTNPGSRPISHADVAGLDSTALRPVITEKVALKAIKTLGLSPEKWDKMKLRAANELGRYMNMEHTARVLLVRGFDSLDQVEYAMGVCRAIMDAKDSQGKPINTPENILLAVRMMTECAKAQKELSGQVLDLAEKSADQAANTGPRRNLPPPVLVQVNNQVAGSTSPGPATATNGEPPARNLPPPMP